MKPDLSMNQAGGKKKLADEAVAPVRQKVVGDYLIKEKKRMGAGTVRKKEEGIS